MQTGLPAAPPALGAAAAAAMPGASDDAAAGVRYWCPATRCYRSASASGRSEACSQGDGPGAGRSPHISDFFRNGPPQLHSAPRSAAVVVPVTQREDRRKGRDRRNARPHITDFIGGQQPPVAHPLPPRGCPPAAAPQQHSGVGAQLPYGCGDALLASPLPSHARGAPALPMQCTNASERSGSGAHYGHTTPQQRTAPGCEATARSSSLSSNGSVRCPPQPYGPCAAQGGVGPHTPLSRNRHWLPDAVVQSSAYATASTQMSVGPTASSAVSESDDGLSCRSGMLRPEGAPEGCCPSPVAPASYLSPLSLQPAPSPGFGSGCVPPASQALSPARPASDKTQSEGGPVRLVFRHDPYREADTVDTPPTAPATPLPPPAAPAAPVTTPSAATVPTVAMVQFKYGRQGEFRVPQGAGISVGDHAIVEGDRGEDLGMVVAIRIAAPADEADPLIVPLTRCATAEEVEWWRGGLAEKEREARQTVQELVNRHGVQMQVQHAEWQFDQRKLTFHFTSNNPHPDFRRVLGECHSIWKCRIWFARYSRLGQDVANRRALSVGGSS